MVLLGSSSWGEVAKSNVIRPDFHTFPPGISYCVWATLGIGDLGRSVLQGDDDRCQSHPSINSEAITTALLVLE